MTNKLAKKGINEAVSFSHPEFSSGSQPLQTAKEDEILKQVQYDFINKKAFTLIELLVVVLIIGILASVALPQYQKAVMKARTAEIKVFINGVQKGIQLYVLENGEWDIASNGNPVPFSELPIDVTGGLTCQNADYYCYKKNDWLSALGYYGNFWQLSIWAPSPSSSYLGDVHLDLEFSNSIGEVTGMCRSHGGTTEETFCKAIQEMYPNVSVELYS